MRNEAVGRSPWQLEYVLNHLKTQKMCGKAVEDESKTLEFVPDHLKLKICVKEPLKMNQKS